MKNKKKHKKEAKTAKVVEALQNGRQDKEWSGSVSGIEENSTDKIKSATETFRETRAVDLDK